MSSTRLTPQEVEDLVLGTITAFSNQLSNTEVEQAEYTLDWTVLKLWEHGYNSAVDSLIGQYHMKYYSYVYGDPNPYLD